MMAGKLNRRVTIQSATVAQDENGEPIQTWATFKTVWAERKDVRGAERFDADQRLAIRTATFRIRWLESVSEHMRVIDAGTIYDVKGIAEERRQGWLELSCESINPVAVQ